MIYRKAREFSSQFLNVDITPILYVVVAALTSVRDVTITILARQSGLVIFYQKSIEIICFGTEKAAFKMTDKKSMSILHQKIRSLYLYELLLLQ